MRPTRVELAGGGAYTAALVRAGAAAAPTIAWQHADPQRTTSLQAPWRSPMAH